MYRKNLKIVFLNEMLISTDMKIKCKLRMRKYIYYLSELINKHTGDITINKILINILIVN